MAIYCTAQERAQYEEKGYWRSLPEMVPSVTFHTRILNPMTDEFEWLDVNTWDIFAGERILMFSLPGAFTPTCSTYQLPSFEQLAEEIYAEGITGIVCMTVNDAFVCNAWANANNLEEIQVIPDGSGKFTEAMNMLVDKDNLGFGRRSWRYACIVDNGTIEDWFIEEGREDNCEEDPYMFTDPAYILNKLREGN
jgi:thioredoxin-dependent peroxiredoxin